MSTNNIQIVISQSGARTVTVNLQGIGQAAEKSGKQVDLLNRALELLGAALAIDQIKKWADAWSTASGLVSVATNNVAEHTAVMDKLFNVAQKSRTSFTDIVELYSAAARQGKELGASQNEVIRFTEGVSKALVIQHTTAAQASGALLQLGQLLGTGKVRAQEFNSVQQGLPVIMQAVAKNIDGAGGSVSRLRAMMTSGQLSSKQFFDAVIKAVPGMQEAFDKANATIGQGLTVLNNAFTKYVGQLNEATGLSNTFAKACQFIAANMTQIGAAAVGMGVAIATAFALSNVTAFTAAIVRLFTLINTNPFVALASAVLGLVAYFKLAGDEMNAGIDKITTYNDVFRAFGATVTDATKDITTAIGEEFSKLTSTTFPDFFTTTQKGFAGVLQIVARVFDALGAGVYIIIFGIKNAVTGIPDLFKTGFEKAYNVVVGIVEDMINEVIDGINKVREAFGQDPIDLVKLFKFDVDESAWKTYGQHIASAVDEGIEAQGGALEKSLDGIFARAQKIAADRVASQAKTVTPNLDVKTKPANFVDPEELKKAQNELRGLLNTVAPAEGALLDMAHAQDILNLALKTGIIDQIRYAEIMGEVKLHYADALNPMKTFHDQLALEDKALNGNVNEIDSYTQALNFQAEQRKKNNFISDETVAKMTAELEAHKKLQRIVSDETAALEDTVNARRNFAENLQAVKKLLDDPASGFAKGDAAQELVKNYGDMLQGTTTWVQGTLNQYQHMYDQIEQMRKQDLIDQKTADQLKIQAAEQIKQKTLDAIAAAAQARLQLGSGDWSDATLAQLNKLRGGFTTVIASMSDAVGDFLTGLRDGLADAIGQAVVHAKSLKEAFGDVAKQITSQLISAIIKMGIQWVSQQALMTASSVTSQTTIAAAAVPAASTITSAYAPAAAVSNAATFGGSADAGAIALAAIFALVAGYAFGKGGFKEGGYTGSYGINDIAGVVHGREFVVNAQATADPQNRMILEAMNSGRKIITSQPTQQSGPFGPLKVSVVNKGTPQDYTIDRVSRNEARLIAEDAVQRKASDAVARDIVNPNSSVSKSIRNNTLTARRRSA